MSSVLRFVLILGAVFAVVLFAMRPDVLEDVWLWITGLIGLIIRLFERAWNFLESKFPKRAEPVLAQAGRTVAGAPRPVYQGVDRTDNRTVEDFPRPSFRGVTLELKRLTDDGSSTLGALSIDGKFFCYTLEDTYRPVKVAGETRIPAGTFVLDFNRTETGLTMKYRAQPYSSEWFSYHLELKKVPGYGGIYIHNGGHHDHTEGCILVSTDYIKGTDSAPLTLTNSKSTFKTLYIKLKQLLDSGAQVRIVIQNETDFQPTNPSMS